MEYRTDCYYNAREGKDIYYYSPDKLHNADGYLSLSGYPRYFSYRRDHLGNIREVWRRTTGSDPASSRVVQRTQYYPSGLPWAEGYNANLQQRKYNGKEWIEAHGYDMFDYGARGYYPASMRFTTMDPLAEKYYSISPYAYCANNPVRFVDPDGRDRVDKVAGVIIGALTNIIPGTSGLRDKYTPNDAGDYNNTLRTVDGVSIIVGGGMMTSGGAGVGAGTSIVIAGGVTASTVVGAPEGAAIAAGGAVVITGSEALMAGGAMLTANAAANASKGYNYGNSSKTSTKVKTRQSKGADGATSKHIIEKDDKGKTVSKTHQVTSPDGKVVHQHQDFVSQTPQKGQKPVTRQFPDEWVKYPNVNTK